MHRPMKNSPLRTMTHFALSRMGRGGSAKAFALIAGVVTCLIFPALAGAVDNSWNGSASPNWSDTGNWSLGHVPTASEVVRFDNLSTANLSMVNNVCAPGDLNCDGSVNAGDYVYWRKTNGSAADYAAFRANFGTTPGIGLPITGIANTSGGTPVAGPTIGGTPTQVTITGLPLRVGSVGIRNGSGTPPDQFGYGAAQVNVTVDTDLYLTADQFWKIGGPGTGTAGRDQAVIIGASPNSHTVFLGGFKPTLQTISNQADIIIVNSKLVDGGTPSSFGISKADVGTGHNGVERVRIAGDNTYSGGTTIVGGRTNIQLGSSSVKIGSTIQSGPFGTGTITYASDVNNVPPTNNQQLYLEAFGADRTVDNDIIMNNSPTIGTSTIVPVLNFASSFDDQTSPGSGITAHYKLTLNGTITVNSGTIGTNNPGLLLHNTLQTGTSGKLDGSGDVIFNGNVVLANASGGLLDVGQGGSATNASSVGKIVFNGQIQQTGGVYGLSIFSGSVTAPVAPTVVQLFGQNTYTGGINITAPDAPAAANANIGLGSDTVLSGSTILSGPLGTGALTLGSNSSSIEALGGARTLANAIRLPLIQGKLTVRGSNDLTLSGAIGLGSATDFGGLIMNGTGKLTLSGAANYSNATLVNTGTMLVNGSIAGSNGVTVAAPATLGGTGSISSTITNNGTIAPGASGGTPGTLNVTGDVTDGAGSFWAIDLSGASSDKLVVTGNIDLSAVDSLNVTGAGTGASWVIATYSGTLTSTFDSVTSGYSVDYGTGSNSQITLHTPGSGSLVSAVPEPGTILLGLFAVGLATVFRRRNHGSR